MPVCTRTKSFLPALLAPLAIAIVAFSSGCGGTASAPQAVANLGIGRPSFNVDADHCQLRNNPDNKYQKYTMGPGREFNLETGSFKFQEIPDYAGKPKMINILAGAGKTFSCPYDDSKKSYLVNPNFPFEKGDHITVGIGYSIEQNGMPGFVPVWVGFIDVQ